MVYLGNDWDRVLEGEFVKEYYLHLRQKLIAEYRTKTIYPDMCDIFNALKETAFCETKVVLLGQDPYHGPGQAHGMCFSVRSGVPKPPSLQNIFEEQKNDVGTTIPDHGCLVPWAKRGVLLLNTVLTVRAGQPNSHKELGWHTLTDRIIGLLGQKEEPVVFLLWGAHARGKQPLIENPRHLVLTAAHPSPLSAYKGFFGCRHFSKTNAFLEQQGLSSIDWQL